MPKTINTASSHLLVLLQPLCSFGLHLCKCLLPNFKILRLPDGIHINQLIHLLLWYEYHCVLRSKQRFLTIFCRCYTVRVQWQKHRKLRLHRGRNTLNVQSSLPPLYRKPLLSLKRKSAFLTKTSEAMRTENLSMHTSVLSNLYGT